MEQEKWGFDVNSHRQTIKYDHLLIQFILVLIVLIIFKPRFVMSQKDDVHIFTISMVKAIVISIIISISIVYTPKMLRPMIISFDRIFFCTFI